jgi:arylsulfatase A-like enzyme
MIRQGFLQAALIGMSLGWIMQSPAPGLDQPRPNVVIILIDDLAYGDLGCFGSPDIPTPHIDLLAKDGVQCTNSYVTNTPCSPSRCSLITGMYAQRFGKYAQMRGLAIPEYKDHPTLGEFMRDAGYVTGQIGKWDIGARHQGPLERGFMQVARVAPKAGGNYTYRKQDGSTGYEVDQDGDYLVEFVENNHEKPFFLYYSPRALHWPNRDSPEHHRAKTTATGARRALGGAIVALDNSIGRMLNTLKKHGLYENTLIMFTSDNGGNQLDEARPDPFIGGKKGGGDKEGYVRMPTLVSWPAVLPKGKVYNGIMASFDFYATAAAAAGKKAPERCDGVNLVEYLSGDSQQDAHEALFWCSHKNPEHNTKCIRWKKWRLAYRKEAYHLYDINVDPREEHNLAAQNPEVIGEMLRRWKKWYATLPPVGKSNSSGGRQPKGYGWATPEDSDVK